MSGPPSHDATTQLVVAAIRDGLRARSMTQRQLADAMGVSEARVSAMPAGRHAITTRTIDRVAAVLHAEPAVELKLRPR